LVARAEHLRSMSDKPVVISGGVLPIMDSDLLDGESASVLAPPSVSPLSDVFVKNLAAFLRKVGSGIC
jgi:hypothetical protein